MNDRLYYRRQFLMANEVIEKLQNWQHQKIGDVHLYAHPDLDLSWKDGPVSFFLILGYIFDPAHPEKTNQDILSDMASRIRCFEDILSIIKPYAGRYAIIYKDESSFRIFHDPLGLREIYYCTRKNKVICGSQPNLLDNFSEPKLGITKNKDILKFYNHDMKSVRFGRLWVGDETYYHNVKHLMPNHYLDIPTLMGKRYWPNKKIERLDLENAVRQSCEYLKGVMMAVTSRFNVMMAVTSGMDSRSLLAASKDVHDKIYYFINKHHHLKSENADIRIPKAIFERINIPFHTHDVETSVDEEFRKIFLQNTFMSGDLLLPAVYNVYYKHHQDKVNLLGVGELGREYYGDAPPDIDGYYLASRLKYRKSRYATDQCEKWLREVKGFAESYNVDIMRLFLWEMLLGNWGAVGNSESDIAIEEFGPYDSHYIYEIMFSIDREDVRNGTLFKCMYEQMWPELLDFPFNPPDTKMDRFKVWMTNIGLYQFLKKIRYKFDRRKFQRMKNSSQ